MSPLAAAPLAVTLGDPAGIGPEIVAAAWAALRTSGPSFFAIGDARTLAAAGAPVAPIAGAAEASDRLRRRTAGARPAAERATPSPAARRPRPPRSWCAGSRRRCSWRWPATAAGVVTAPIAKATLYDAGFAYPGHTEFIGELTARRADAPARAGR